MKKIFIVFLLIVFFVFMFGCAKDDVSNDSTTNDETTITVTEATIESQEKLDVEETDAFETKVEEFEKNDLIETNLVDMANKSWDFEKYLTKWATIINEAPSTNCKIFVRGKETKAIKYAHILDKNKATIPMISLLEELGATVEWYGEEGDKRAAILYNDTLYILYVQYASLFNTETGRDYFFGVAGGTITKEFAFIDNEFVVDSSWGIPILSEVFDVRLKVDYELSCIYAYDKGTSSGNAHNENIEITGDEAIEIASNYWGIKNGEKDEETGFSYLIMPVDSTNNNITIALKWLVDNHHYSTIDSIEIDSSTGEILNKD